MTDFALRVEGLSKCYRIGERRPYKLLRESIASALRRPFAGGRSGGEWIWALKDVSFEVRRGEVLAVIGRNGAGKSTLLKILSRITEPDRGRVEICGRVGSLLEVGTGFHPELTGRENIFLNGAILGMRRAETTRRFDDIVAFAEVEKFIDTPVKHYSSGMYLRLAFAVAAHLEPEILLVDEVLAVGDADFQKRCLGKMGEVAQGGRTVLFVSHNMSAVLTLTKRCLVLDAGRVTLDGDTNTSVQRYLSRGVDESRRRPGIAWFRRGSTEPPPVRFEEIWVGNDPSVVPTIGIGEDFTLQVVLTTSIWVRGAHVGVGLKRNDGCQVMVMLSTDAGFPVVLPPGRHRISCRVVGLPLAPGSYVADIGVGQGEANTAWDVILDYPLLAVEDHTGAVRYWLNRPWGAVYWERMKWAVEENVGDARS